MSMHKFLALAGVSLSLKAKYVIPKSIGKLEQLETNVFMSLSANLSTAACLLGAPLLIPSHTETNEPCFRLR
ncbi:unnamed protein product [Merluccius merluccius]